MFFRILETTIVRKLPAFTTYSDNAIQYRQATFHNTMIDIDCTTDQGQTCTVAALIRDHGMSLAFYAMSLPILARDGYVALESGEPETDLDRAVRAAGNLSQDALVEAARNSVDLDTDGEG